ncbi:family 43 glycosylhydrolase [Chitinophaga sp.]|uniref:family 43 glycosylhydrolase n=1 Tax=Chitinophaga sp. TaxID=1869181 RepID=UPI0026051B63|nr:family 43 glycosylhydrolase [uncultured Chitinophaga sp.]
MAANPIIRHKFTADPTVLEHAGTVYLFTGHDDPPPDVDDYVMKDWLCFTSTDLKAWDDRPSPLKATDFSWASGDAYASKVIAHGGAFYWFVAVSHRDIPGKAIGVAKALSPGGPWHDAIGAPLITGDMLPQLHNDKENLDPTVYIDDDGKAYICWGHQVCHFAQLNASFTALESEIRTIGLPQFMEGSHLYRKNGWYYLMYGYGQPEQIGYAMSRSIHGPWEFRGIVCGPAVNSETNRPATLDFMGKSWLFYHNGALPGGGSHRRSVCVDELHYMPDGTIAPLVMT